MEYDPEYEKSLNPHYESPTPREVIMIGNPGIGATMATINADRHAQGLKEIVVIDDQVKTRPIDMHFHNYLKDSNMLLKSAKYIDSLSPNYYNPTKKIDKRFTPPKKKRKKK